jgi:hypothetical protein
MVRSILSIITGYVVFLISVMILWLAFGYGPKDIPPTNFLVFSVFCEALFSAGCGYLTAAIAQRRALLHAGILAAVFVIVGLGSLVFQTHRYPFWIPLSTVFINAPCALLGGYLRYKRRKKG